MRGVIDSADMPLNLSREMLQNNPDVAAIRKAVTNRVLSRSEEMRRAGSGGPSQRSGRSLRRSSRRAFNEDMERRDQLFEIARFRSTRARNVSLRDYVKGLKENLTAIYYITAEDAAKAAASPQLEVTRRATSRLLLFTDPVDSFWVRTALGYDGKPFKSVTQGSADLDAIKPAKDAATPPRSMPTWPHCSPR